DPTGRARTPAQASPIRGWAGRLPTPPRRGRRSPRRRRPRRSAARSCSGPLLEVAAELEPHRRQQAVLEVGLASRGEAREERGREDVRGHGLVDGPEAIAALE